MAKHMGMQELSLLLKYCFLTKIVNADCYRMDTFVRSSIDCNLHIIRCLLVSFFVACFAIFLFYMMFCNFFTSNTATRCYFGMGHLT